MKMGSGQKNVMGLKHNHNCGRVQESESQAILNENIKLESYENFKILGQKCK
jgi:hypothetical protein